MIEDRTEVRQAPTGGLVLEFPLDEDVLVSMLRKELIHVPAAAIAASVAAIRAGDQGFTLLLGASYDNPIGSASNGSATVAIIGAILRITLKNYLPTVASETVRNLVAAQVRMSVGVGIAGDYITEQVLIDGVSFTRRVLDQRGDGMLCEGRVRLADAPGTKVRRRWV